MFKHKIIRQYLAIDSEFVIKLLGNGSSYEFLHQGSSYLLCWSNEKYYALLNKCPHQNKKMTGAKCEDGRIECPVHNYKFSIETGKGHGMSIPTFEVEIKEDGFYLLVPKLRWF